MTESESIDEYVRKLSGVASNLATLGETIEETKLMNMFLKILHQTKFIHIIASLKQVLNLKTTRLKMLWDD